MKYKSATLIFTGFTLLGLIVTYPLILKMSSYIYGTPGDSLTNIYWFWWWKYAWQNNLSFTEIPLLSAPFGIKILNPFLNWPLYSSCLAAGLTFLTNEIFTYNLLVLLSFPLAAITMYFLVYHFTKNKLASMVSGIIYSFSPYHFWHGFQHLSVAQIQWMPLYILFLFRLSEERNYRNAILCGFLFSVVALETFYYGYFMLIFTGTFILWLGWQGLRRKNREQVSRWESGQVSKKQRVEAIKLSSNRAIKTDRRRDGKTERRADRSPITEYRSPLKTVKVVLVAVVIALAIILPFTHSILKMAFISSPGEFIAEGGLSRPFEDLFMYSARPLGYLLPSIDHPILGRYTKNFVETPFYGGHPIEQTLYLGWVGIILSIIAVREWRRKNREQAPLEVIRPRRGRMPRLWRGLPTGQVRKWESGKVGKGETGKVSRQAIKTDRRTDGETDRRTDRSRKGVSFFLFAGIAALLFSFEPYLELGNFRIFFPSYFTYKIIPMVRIIARFGIVVLLSISVLAGIGLAFILKKISTPKKRGIFVFLIILFIFFEFTNIPPFHTTDVSTIPPVYKWLAQQPGDFIIAEYPLGADSRYLFYQRIHQKRLVNGALPGSQADRICQKITNIIDPKTPGILHHLGVKYVIFHPEEYLKSDRIAIIGELPDFSQQKGLKLVKTFDTAQVYEITAKSIKP